MPAGTIVQVLPRQGAYLRASILASTIVWLPSQARRLLRSQYTSQYYSLATLGLPFIYCLVQSSIILASMLDPVQQCFFYTSQRARPSLVALFSIPASIVYLAQLLSRTLLIVYIIANLINVFISNIKKGQYSSFLLQASISPVTTKLQGQAYILFDLLASLEYTYLEPLAIFNGDIGLQPATKINVLYNILLATLNILKFFYIVDDLSSALYFQQYLEQKRALYYLSYYIDNQFHAIFAIYYFNKRHYKVIDVLGGNFATPLLSIFKVTTIDSERIVDKSLVTLLKETELFNITIQLKKIHAQIPTLLASVDNNYLQILLYKGDTKYQYIVSLKIGTSFIHIYKDLILKKKAITRDLDKRYIEILLLSIDIVANILTLLYTCFLKGRVYIVLQDIENAFYISLREYTRSYLFNQEGLALAFIEIKGYIASIQEAYSKVVKLLNYTTITSDLINILEPPPILQPQVLKLLDTSKEELTSQKGFSQKCILLAAASPKLKFTPYQIISTIQVIQKVYSPIHGAILANDIDTSKTLTVALSILIHYYRYLELRQQGKPYIASPIIQNIQANLVSQTFKEFYTAFPSYFRLYIYYSDSTYSNPDIVQATITKDCLAQLRKDQAIRNNDLEISNPYPHPPLRLTQGYYTSRQGRLGDQGRLTILASTLPLSPLLSLPASTLPPPSYPIFPTSQHATPSLSPYSLPASTLPPFQIVLTGPQIYLDILITSYTTLLLRNVQNVTVDIEPSNIAYTRPELIDRLIYNKATVDDILRRSIPLYLQFAASRSGAGCNTRLEYTRVLETKQYKIAKAYRYSAEPLDYKKDNKDIEDNTIAILESELLSSPTPSARKISVEVRKSSFSLEDAIAKVDSILLQLAFYDIDKEKSDNKKLYQEYIAEVIVDSILGYRREKVATYYYIIFLSSSPFQPSFIVLDKVYNVKDLYNVYSRSTLLLPSYITIFITATSILNLVEDYFRLILQIQRYIGFYNFLLLPEAGDQEYIVQDFKIAPINLLKVYDLYIYPYLYPQTNDPIDLDSIYENNKTLTNYILQYKPGYSPDRKSLFEQSLASGVKQQLLYPSAIRYIRADRSLESVASDVIYYTIQEIVTIYIPINAYIDLPNSTFIYPREEILPFDVQYIEVRFNYKCVQVIAAIVTSFLHLLPNIANITDSSIGPTTYSKTTKGTTLTNTQTQTINIHYYRLLTIGAIDYRSFIVLTKVKDRLSLYTSYNRLASFYYDEIEHRLISDSTIGITRIKELLKFATENKFTDQTSPSPKFSSAYTKELVEQYLSSGLIQLYSISPESLNTIPSTSYFSILYQVLNKSPVLTELFDLYLSIYYKGLYSLIIVNSLQLQK